MSEYQPRRNTGGDAPGGAALMRENFLQAFEVIRGRRLRSGLLILGVAIGVTAILAVVAIMLGLESKIESDFTAAEKPYVSLHKYDALKEGPHSPRATARPDINPGDAEMLQQYCDAAAFIDFRYKPAAGRIWRLSRGAERTQPISIIGTDISFLNIHPIDMEYGRYFNEQEVTHRKPVVVLAYGPAQDLFPHTDPIGQSVRIGPRQYVVIGTIARRKSILGGMADNFGIVPWTTYEKDLKGELDEGQVVLAPVTGRSLDELTEQVIEVMRVRHNILPGDENDFETLSSEAFAGIVGRVTGAIGMVLIVISSIGLLVGGIGVMNIMLVSVTERTREVGLRMSLGARRKDVLFQFLVEASTLTGLGGFFGVIGGMGAAWGVSRASGFPFRVSVFWIVIAVVFSAGIGLLFGLYPANRAAKMDPIEALRHE